MELLNKIARNVSNAPVLDFLDVNLTDKELRFKNWEEASSGFDEGGIALFDKFGANIPIECKYALDIHNIMVYPATGEIFAFHTGRYSLFLKVDFDYFGLTNSDAYRRGYTFDCISDITELGSEWAFMDDFAGSEGEKLERTYQLLTERGSNSQGKL